MTVPKMPELQKVISWRCSKQMLSAIASFGGGELSQQQVFSYAIQAFLNRPTLYRKIDVKAMREPTVKLLSFNLPMGLYQQVVLFAAQYSLSISSVVRMAIYQEVVCCDTETTGN